MGKENRMYTYNMMVFSLKKAEILQYDKIQMNLEDIMINEIRAKYFRELKILHHKKKWKEKYCIILLI